MKKILLLILLIPQIAYAQLPNYCRRFQLPGWWGSGEYLLVWRKQRFYPPLVTTSPLGTAFGDSGILGLPTTTILFGDEHVGDSPQSGGRFDAGFWLTPCLGFGATWTFFGKEHVNFLIEGNDMGNPIFAVPFFDTGMMAESAIVLSHPDGYGQGTLEIDTTNNIWAADLYTRWRCCDWNCWRVDLLGGFRYTRLTDSLNFTTSSFDLVEPEQPIVELETVDFFSAENSFYSGLVGVIGEYRYGRWAFQVCGRFGIGNMVKKVAISGQTIVIDDAGEEIVIPQGIFAQTSNSGNHSENSFEVVSEGEAKLGVYVWRNLMLTAGYHIMYWPKIYLAGEQVDRNIPEPQFPGRNSNFWTQSLTVGIYFLY